MGSLTQATCICGYSSEPLTEGYGFDSGRDNRCVRCDICRAVVVVNILLHPVRCTQCDEPPAELYPTPEERSSRDTYRFSCPCCRRMTAVLGRWD